MSIQAQLNQDSMACVPVIQAIVSISDSFDANQMEHSTLRAMMNSPVTIVDMTGSELEEFQRGLIEGFKYHNWITTGGECMERIQNAVRSYADEQAPSTYRAQCLTIANYKLVKESFSERIKRDHSDSTSALRHSRILVKSGVAVEIPHKKGSGYFGTFVFLDGSILN